MPRDVDYPRPVVRANVRGNTLLRIEIDSDGRVSRIDIERPSGSSREHRLLDELAVKKLRTCVYERALDDMGRPTPGVRVHLYDVQFKLTE